MTIIILVNYHNIEEDYNIFFALGLLCLLVLIINIILHYNQLKELDLFSPAVAFPVVYIFIIGTAVILNIGIGYGYIWKIDLRMMYYLLIGLICYAYGNILVFLLFPRKTFYDSKKIGNQWSQKNIFEWGTIITMIATIGIIIYYLNMEVPLLGNVDKIRHGLQGRTYGIGFSFTILQGLNAILLVYLVYQYKYFRNGPLMGWMLLSILWILIITASTGYRWLCVAFMIVPFMGYNYIVKRLNLNVKTIAITIITIIVLLSFIGYFGYHRKVSRFGGADQYLYDLNLLNIPVKFRYVAPALFSLQTPLKSFSELLPLLPNEYDYFHGKYCLATIPIISRIVTSLSKENTGIFITDTIFGLDYRGGSGGTALTIVGSLYIDYGIIAIVLGMILIGIFTEISYQYLIKTPSLLKVTIYSLFLWIIIKWIVSGIFIGDLFILVAVFVIDKLIKNIYIQNNKQVQHGSIFII